MFLLSILVLISNLIMNQQNSINLLLFKLHLHSYAWIKPNPLLKATIKENNIYSFAYMRVQQRLSGLKGLKLLS